MILGFHVSTREAKSGDRFGAVYLLADDAGTAQAEVWPTCGFNCLRWRVRIADGEWGDMLYTAPDWERNQAPTTSGHSIFFASPDRTGAGRTTGEGGKQDPSSEGEVGEYVTHEFLAKGLWKVVGTEGRSDFAAITGRFQLSENLKSGKSWRTEQSSLTITYRLFTDSLRVEAEVQNHGCGPLWFGLGYRSYFCAPTALGATVNQLVLHAAGGALWKPGTETVAGRREPLPRRLDFRAPREIGAVVMDDWFGDLSPDRWFVPGLQEVAWIEYPSSSGRLSVRVAPVFRRLHLLIPSHRRAVMIAPWTCVPDVLGIAAPGGGSGWWALGPDQTWRAGVEYRWEPRLD
jgi:galactose mutarotase-like enzyme